jgi:hypothetical protein
LFSLAALAIFIADYAIYAIAISAISLITLPLPLFDAAAFAFC